MPGRPFRSKGDGRGKRFVGTASQRWVLLVPKSTAMDVRTRVTELPFPEQSLERNLSVPEDRLRSTRTDLREVCVEGSEMCCEVLAPCERSIRGARRVRIGR
jgi:hypothetical protein